MLYFIFAKGELFWLNAVFFIILLFSSVLLLANLFAEFWNRIAGIPICDFIPAFGYESSYFFRIIALYQEGNARFTELDRRFRRFVVLVYKYAAACGRNRVRGERHRFAGAFRVPPFQTEQAKRFLAE